MTGCEMIVKRGDDCAMVKFPAEGVSAVQVAALLLKGVPDAVTPAFFAESVLRLWEGKDYLQEQVEGTGLTPPDLVYSFKMPEDFGPVESVDAVARLVKYAESTLPVVDPEPPQYAFWQCSYGDIGVYLDLDDKYIVAPDDEEND